MPAAATPAPAAKNPAGGAVSPATAASALAAAGFPAKDIPIMVAIAGAESGFRTDATNHNKNGSTDYGLWQINGTANKDVFGRGDWRDPVVNARMAKIIFDRQGLKAWTVYKTGAYQKYMSIAQGTGSASPTAGADAPSPSQSAPAGPTTTTFNPLAMPDLTPWFLKPDFFARMAWWLLAILLILIGLFIVFRRETGDTIKVAADAGITVATRGLNKAAGAAGKAL